MLSTGKAVRARRRGLRLISQILLAVQLLSFGHLLSSAHVTCPEHGDIIHVQRTQSAMPARLDVAPAAVRQSMVAAEASVESEHDHCLACVDASRRFLLLGQSQPMLAHHALVSVVHSARSAFFAPVDLILLSPKNSPPLA
jgi:hypothetical protein